MWEVPPTFLCANQAGLSLSALWKKLLFIYCTLFSLFATSCSLPLTPSFSSLSVCASLIDVSSELLSPPQEFCQQSFSSRRHSLYSCIPFRQPRFNLGAQKTEIHKHRLLDAHHRHAGDYPQSMTESPASWMGEEPALVVLCFWISCLFFTRSLSLEKRENKIMWIQDCLPADFTVWWDLRGSKTE